MIRYTTGNIFDSSSEALVNTVNTVGVMGKGIALQFKKAYPNNYKAYADACKDGDVQIGKLFVFTDSNIDTGERIIINFPTKKSWRKPSEYSFIEKGLDDLVRIIDELQIKSIAIPPLGAGNGGLQWEEVKKIVDNKLHHLDIDIVVYEPTSKIVEKLKNERVKLTKARALLLYILFDLVRNGEYVSEFSSEKVCYFLQRFGAKKYFKLSFEPKFYGPYSGKVRYVLNVLNGSYIMGYSDMSKKPFEPLTLVSDSYNDVVEMVQSDPDLHRIATDTSKFLNGFYSDFSLELLSSVDFLSAKHNSLDQELILAELNKWNTRKRSMFTNPRYLNISLKHVNDFRAQMV
jgi:O-acetyl-ADP-ribose deacetylase (regulator of RNase III)